jgi:hypothetical protein
MKVVLNIVVIFGLALLAQATIESATGASDEERCNSRAEANTRQFDRMLRVLHPGDTTTTAADLQKLVVDLCVTGTPEREAYTAVINVLGH